MKDGSLAACVAMCACCEHCNFVSYSAKNQDCSWNSKCNLERLLLNGADAHGPSYTTVNVRGLPFDHDRRALN